MYFFVKHFFLKEDGIKSMAVNQKKGFFKSEYEGREL